MLFLSEIEFYVKYAFFQNAISESTYKTSLREHGKYIDIRSNGKENIQPTENQKEETNSSDITKNGIKDLDMNIKDMVSNSSLSPKLLKKLLKEAIKFKFFIKLALKWKNQIDTSIRLH